MKEPEPYRAGEKPGLITTILGIIITLAGLVGLVLKLMEEGLTGIVAAVVFSALVACSAMVVLLIIGKFRSHK
jgi:hypothetical protein